MNDNETAPHFCNDKCDTCGRGPSVMLYHNNTPVLSQCRECMPSIHESVARADVDKWLNGGNTCRFGR